MRHPSRTLSCLSRLVLFAALLACFHAVPARGQEAGAEGEPASQDTGDGDRKDDKAEVRQQAAEEVEQKRGEEVRQIEQAAKEPWISKWGRFRKATRDISEWNFKEGMFRMRFGLRLQLDGTAGNVSTGLEDQVGGIDESFKARRARLFADGDFLRRYHFRFEYDFAADSGLKDAYVDNLFRYALKHVAVRAGNFKEPFSLARHTSSNYLAFLEWPLPVQTFAPGRNLGIATYGVHRGGRIAWTAGAFTNLDSGDDNRSASAVTFTARMTGLPQFREDGRRLVHLGLSLSVRDPSEGVVRYATRPEARFTPFFIDTGKLEAGTTYLAGFEIATVQGPFWLQAELLTARPQLKSLGDRTFGGAYTEAGWFLTGEHRPYRTADGAFGRLEPLHPYRFGGNPFKKGGNGGALELTGRVSYVDLNDGPVQGGRMLDAGFGLSWYATRATRLSLNYIRSRVEGEGHANIVLIRYQFNPGYHWPPLDPRWHRPGPPDD